ncbi:hypothetical protein LMH63_15725 [Spiribacter halobius]|nr:hypothetical protein [Spiribacter halobius]UEX77376.1 hypothetical protein LMH63_15725 [Spiribacter halobius]
MAALGLEPAAEDGGGDAPAVAEDTASRVQEPRDRVREALAALDAPATAARIQRSTGLATHQIRRALQSLRAEGEVTTTLRAGRRLYAVKTSRSRAG